MKHSMPLFVAAAWMLAAPVTFAADCAPLSLKESVDATPRPITVADQLTVRRVDVLKVSPDQRRYAMLVRQPDAAGNRYCRSWFVGDLQGGAPVFLGEGGEAELALGILNRYVGGEFDKPAVRWSPDGSWLAYVRPVGGEKQVWLSRTDGSAREQLTRNAADVDKLEWSADGKSLYFTVGTPRAELQARSEKRERQGYHYDTELVTFADFMLPRHEGVDADTARSVWVVSPAQRQERLADAQERSAFERAQAQIKVDAKVHTDAMTVSTVAQRPDGAQAWAARADTKSLPTINATLRKGSRPITCPAPQCSGLITNVWWRSDGTVIFMRAEGVAYSTMALYAWSPKSRAVSTLLQVTDEVLTNCEQASNDMLVCVRETPSRPPHLAAIDLKSSATSIVADVNPEFRSIRLGAVERFEWSTPKFSWNAPGTQLERAYEDRAWGYILYPPDFVAERKYPVFMSPYAADGFDNITNFEYPLHALAAAGFVVISTSWPAIPDEAYVAEGPQLLQKLYSAELGFPHLTMLSESTLKALDRVLARGFIDDARVGIGGVSHGAFVPLHMVLKHDRFAALAVSGSGWDPLEYYGVTKQGRSQAVPGYASMFPLPVGDGWKYWQQVSLAENVDKIEAPLLFNATAAEMLTLIRLLRHMEDAGKPYDAYVFPRETHIKFQPAHLEAIMQRNVDWLRFWLQSYEDPAPDKTVQYGRWRKLREMRDADRSRARTGAEG